MANVILLWSDILLRIKLSRYKAFKAFKKLGYGLPFTGNINKMDTIKGLNITDNFLKEIPLIWSKINFEQRLTSERQFHEQNLRFNSLVRINNAPIYYREWECRGIRKIKHLKGNNDNFSPFKSCRTKTT